MAQTDFQSSVLHVSTDALAVKKRLPFVRDVIGRQLCNMDIAPLKDDFFEAHLSLSAIPGLRMMECVMSSARLQRTHDIVADGDDAISIAISLSGSLNFFQLGREILVESGDAVMQLNAEPGRMVHSDIRGIGLVVPRTALTPLVRNLEDLTVRIIPRNNEALRLLISYLTMVQKGLFVGTPELSRLVASHVHQLIALAIGPTRDGAVIAAEGGIRAARLSAIKADIDAALDRRDLNVEMIARHQRITPRYVQMLFEQEGTTFSQFVLGQRLRRAHELLTDAAHAGWNISAIAMAAGFDDLSHFNRSFRRRYGATPSDIRRAGRTRSA